MAKIKISVPDELVKKYDLHSDDDFQITARNGEIRLKKNIIMIVTNDNLMLSGS